MTQTTDYLVLGSGLAGLYFALRASEHGNVTVVTKRIPIKSVLIMFSVEIPQTAEGCTNHDLTQLADATKSITARDYKDLGLREWPADGLNAVTKLTGRWNTIPRFS